MLTIRSAETTDAPALVTLSAAWQRDQLATTKNGFLGAAFSLATFTALIEQQCVVVAIDNGAVVGYYLINTVSTDGNLAVHGDAVAGLKRQGMLPKAASVGVGAQALLDQPYQGRGIRPQMLEQLLLRLAGRYDYLFSTISKENPRAYRAHTADGWQVMGEDNTYYFVLLPVPTSST